jgi:hypothetical protein
MANADDELNQIEKDIRTLKIEYEQFFGGGRKRPPSDTQWRVETMIKRYADRSGDLTYGQRFRYNNLSQTYAKYQDMWRKKLMQKEGATAEHHFGAAARAVQEARARESQRNQVATSPSQPATHAGHRRAAADEAAPDPALENTGPRQPPSAFALSFTDPEHEIEKVETLYKKLIQARREAGEESSAPSLKDFTRFVRRKTRDLMEKGGHEIEYTVSIEGGQVRLKARVSS